MTYQNGKVIAMSLALSNEPSPAENIYSTEEQVIGQWIDGKPLYRKCAQLRTLSETNVSGLLVSLKLPIESICTLRGITYSSDNLVRPIPYIYASSDYIGLMGSNIPNDGVYIYEMHNQSKFSSIPLIIILEYTKTTDQSSTVNEFLLSSSAVDPSIQEVTYAPASFAKTL